MSAMSDIVQLLALAVAAAFTGAAIYINVAEHPARMSLDIRCALAQWQPAYKRGAMMQASLAILGFMLGVWSGLMTQDALWYVGAVVLVSVWPYTLVRIMPVNKTLEEQKPEHANDHTRALLTRWNQLHAHRSILGLIATLLMLVAAR
jgi:hypothetical protein